MSLVRTGRRESFPNPQVDEFAPQTVSDPPYRPYDHSTGIHGGAGCAVVYVRRPGLPEPRISVGAGSLVIVLDEDTPRELVLEVAERAATWKKAR